MGVTARVSDEQAAVSLVENAVKESGRMVMLGNRAATNPHFGPLLKPTPVHGWHWKT